MPKTDAAAAVLKVAGPGLPISGMAASSRRMTFSTMVEAFWKCYAGPGGEETGDARLMAGTKPLRRQPGLEHSCEAGIDLADQIVTAPSARGMARLQAYFKGRPFAPHRHDTYGIGITTLGVQSFSYRGDTFHSLPGQVYVLHPDELHDGRAGTEQGFGYRILYLDPGLIRDAVAGRGLPFVADAVSDDRGLRAAIGGFLSRMNEAICDLEGIDMVLALATALERISGAVNTEFKVDQQAVGKARDLLAASIEGDVGSRDLETVTGHDRWALARQFRAAFGVSPYRFLTMRRLENAQALIAAGSSLAETAQASGFADQSHLTRQFRGAVGMPPGAWRRLNKA